jgi:4-amino-4-deoxy-L-arabinose transferase-like glycosyltransferase
MDDRPPPPLATGLLAALAVAMLALQLAVIGEYGWFRDELYYLASTERLGWGYVDHPPLSIALLALVRAAFGDSIVAVRMVPALAGAATVFVTGAIARQLGGGRSAQGLAALCALASPVFLALCHYYSMNALDLLVWAIAAWLLLRALEDDGVPGGARSAGGSGRIGRWAALGAVLGLGLLNKISVLWLGAGIAAGLLLTPHRRALHRPGPYLAAAIAGLIFLPHVLWQVRHGWPTLEFMHNATTLKMSADSPLGVLADLVLSMNPFAAPVWLTGLAFGLFACAGAAGGADPNPDRRGRVLAWIYLTVLALLLAAGRSRASYLAPAYPMLLALGGVAIERFSAAGGRRWLRPAAPAAVALGGAAALPFALPVLPVETFVRYQAAIGLEPGTDERHEMGALPQQYADMHGWEQMVGLVAEAYGRLSPAERRRARVFGQNYGEAGAVDVLGEPLGLPPAISGHNSYWLWGPDAGEWDVLIIIGGDREDNARYFEEVEIVGRTESRWSMLYERGLDVTIARRPTVSIEDAWPRLKHYD